jgi:hypothetical protein
MFALPVWLSKLAYIGMVTCSFNGKNIDLINMLMLSGEIDTNPSRNIVMVD